MFLISSGNASPQDKEQEYRRGWVKAIQEILNQIIHCCLLSSRSVFGFAKDRGVGRMRSDGLGNVKDLFLKARVVSSDLLWVAKE